MITTANQYFDVRQACVSVSSSGSERFSSVWPSVSEIRFFH